MEKSVCSEFSQILEWKEATGYRDYYEHLSVLTPILPDISSLPDDWCFPLLQPSLYLKLSRSEWNARLASQTTLAKWSSSASARLGLLGFSVATRSEKSSENIRKLPASKEKYLLRDFCSPNIEILLFKIFAFSFFSVCILGVQVHSFWFLKGHQKQHTTLLHSLCSHGRTTKVSSRTQTANKISKGLWVFNSK